MNLSRRRTLLVSIDAACWEYLDPLLAQGRLPNVKGLMESGVHGILRSTMPPLTPVAWSSIATGKGPAKHGVYEWVRRKQDGYEFLPYTASDRIGTPVWEKLAEHDIKVGLVNVPFTYPPPRVHGFVVCGFGTPESAQQITYPVELRNEIEELHGPYQPAESGSAESSTDLDALYEAERRLQEQQVRIAISSAERYDTDILFINLMLLDHVNHYLPDMRHVEDAIACTDSHLGVLLEGFQPDNVLLISDHGSRRIHGRFLLGSWLSDHGYHTWPNHRQIMRDYLNWLLKQILHKPLRWSQPTEKLLRKLVVETWLRMPSKMSDLLWRVLGKRLPVESHRYWASPDRDSTASQVYSGGASGCLYLNVKGREPHGIVPPCRQNEVLTQLATELARIPDPDTGQSLFSHIYERNCLYSGSAVGQPPDLALDHYSSQWGLTFQIPLQVMSQDGYFVRDTDVWYGEHSRDGLFVFAGTDIVVNSERGSASLLDIPATLLHLRSVPIPDDFDGRVLVECLDPSFVSTHPVSFQPGDAVRVPEREPAYSEADAADILDRLRSLGYVE